MNLGFIYRLPPLGRVALALDRAREDSLDALLSSRRGTARDAAVALDALREDPHDALSRRRLDGAARALLTELRSPRRDDRAWARAAAAIDGVVRSEREELLDGALLPEPVKTVSMTMLHAANTVLGSYPVWRDAIGVALRGAREAHVVDLAAGTGGFGRYLVRHPVPGCAMTVTTTDLRPEYVAAGERRAEGLPLRHAVCDALDQRPLRAAGGCDLLCCFQAVHHLGPGMLLQMMSESLATATRGLLIVDLARSAFNVAAVGAAVSVIAPNPVLVYDGMLSVRRSYSTSELTLLARLAGAREVTARAFGPGHALAHLRR